MTDNADDQALHGNTPAQNKSLLHSVEQAAGCIGFYVNADKTEFMCFKQERAISTLSGQTLKLVDKFPYFIRNISSTESDRNILLENNWMSIDRLSIMWKPDLPDKIKRDFFQAVLLCLNSDKANGEKDRCCFEQILEATPHETTALRRPSISQIFQDEQYMWSTAGEVKTNA